MAKRTSICILLLLLTLTAAVPARAEEGAASPYLPCTITVPAGREAFAGNLTDDNDATRFTLTSGQAGRRRPTLPAAGAGGRYGSADAAGGGASGCVCRDRGHEEKGRERQRRQGELF